MSQIYGQVQNGVKYTPHNKPEQLKSQGNTFHLYSEAAPFTTQP